MSALPSNGMRLTLATLLTAFVAAGAYWLGTQHGSESAAQANAGAERKILFYRNPMGLPDTSPVPKKDPMGMDYIPVFAGEEKATEETPDRAGAAIRISTAKIQKLGVKTEPAQRRTLDRIVRAAGRIEPDERRLSTIAPKFEGYVERLHVSVTGQPVSKGQALFEVYSPELLSAQREYALAAQGVDTLKQAGSDALSGMQQLADASLARLRNWDISEAQIRALKGGSEGRRSLTYSSPVNGIVIEKKALQGMRFMPGEALYQIADLSSVWVIADVFEQDIGGIAVGAKATVRINAYPDKTFTGTLSYVYPTLNANTRTVPVRIELANPGLLLKPAMYAQVELSLGARQAMVSVPLSAVIDSGTRQIVLVDAGGGRFEPRDVKLGTRNETAVEILSGVAEGEAVVVAANFLIDAESNLKAAIAGFSPAKTGSDGLSPAKGATVSHHADGTVDAIDVASNALTISHAPVASLKWPAMTMEFTPANPALIKGLKPGTAIRFEFVERQPGEWVITAIQPAVSRTVAPKSAAADAAHAAH